MVVFVGVVCRTCRRRRRSSSRGGIVSRFTVVCDGDVAVAAARVTASWLGMVLRCRRYGVGRELVLPHLSYLLASCWWWRRRTRRSTRCRCRWCWPVCCCTRLASVLGRCWHVRRCACWLSYLFVVLRVRAAVVRPLVGVAGVGAVHPFVVFAGVVGGTRCRYSSPRSCAVGSFTVGCDGGEVAVAAAHIAVSWSGMLLLSLRSSIS